MPLVSGYEVTVISKDYLYFITILTVELDLDSSQVLFDETFTEDSFKFVYTVLGSTSILRWLYNVHSAWSGSKTVIWRFKKEKKMKTTSYCHKINKNSTI